MESSPPKSGRLAGLAFILAALVVAVLFGRAFLSANTELQTGILAGGVGLVVTLWTQDRIKKRDREARLHDKKIDAYGKLLDVFYGILDRQRTGRGPNQARLEAQMLDAKRGMLIWGSAEFIRAWTKMEEESDAPTSDKNRVLSLDEVLRLIRKDLGHDDSAMVPGELIGVLLKADARQKLLGK